MKKYLSLLLAIVMLTQALFVSTAFAANEGSYLFYEAFDSCVTNSVPDNVVGSGDTRVMQTGVQDKAMLLSANESVALYNISGEFPSEFIVELDIERLSDGINADIISIGTSSAASSLFTVGKRSAKLCDGRPVSGFRQNKEVTVAAKINLEKGIYSFYIDKKPVTINYPLPKSVTTVNLIKIQVFPTEEMQSEFLVDNIRVYSGSDFIHNSIKVPYNSEELEWPRKTTVSETPYAKITLDDFESYNIGDTDTKDTYLFPKNETNTNSIAVAGNKYNKTLNYHRVTSDPLLDFITRSTGAKDMVVDFEITLNSVTSSAQLLIQFIGLNSVGNFRVLTVNAFGDIHLSDGSYAGNIKLKEKNHFVFLIRQNARQYDIIVNGSTLMSNLAFGNASFASLQQTRFTAMGSGTLDFDIDNFGAYEGSNSVENLPEIIKKDFESYHYMSNEEVVASFAKGETGFNTETNKAVVNNEFIELSVKPFEQDGVVYMPEELVRKMSTQIEAASETVDGNVYYKMKDVADALGMETFSEQGGFQIISPNANDYEGNWSNFIEKKLLLTYYSPTPEEIYSNFVKTSENVHPRLILTAKDFGRLKGEIQTDNIKKAAFNNLVKKAETYLNMAVPVYSTPDGKRLIVHNYRDPIIILAMLYHLTGEARYAERAKEFVLAIAKFDNFNQERHYLDVGVGGTILAIGYDWLYNLYTDTEKQIILDGIKRNCLTPHYNGLFRGEFSTFPRKAREHEPANNWMAITSAGPILCGLVYMETDPEYSSMMIASTLRNFQYMLPNYEPDGAWQEGPGYWGYASQFYAYIVEGMLTALGTDFGYYDIPGTDHTGYYPYDLYGAQGSFNFGDSSDDSATALSVWHAYKNNDSNLYYMRSKEFASGTMPSYWDMLYYDSDAVPEYTELALDSLYGRVDSGTMRTEFFNPNATFVGYHCGVNTVIHKHFDEGSFVFDSLGVRWALDLGLDNYDLPSYNANETNRVYRLRTEGHNCYVINPDEYVGQKFNNPLDGIVKTDNNKSSSYAVMELSDTYSYWTNSAKRAVKLAEGRNTFTVRDEIDIKEDNSEFYWFMHTQADIEVNGNVAYMRQKNQTMKFEFISNQPLELGVMDAKPLPTSPIEEGQADNAGYRKIYLNGNVSGKLDITVKMSPVVAGVKFRPVEAENIPIDEWKLDEDFDVSVRPELENLIVNGAKITGFAPEKKNYNLLSVSESSKLDINAVCSDEYQVDITSSESGDIYQILVTPKNNPYVYTIYSIGVKKIQNSNIADGERFIMPADFYASDEPQPANALVNIMDADLNTRWSANNVQHAIYELDGIYSVAALDIAVHQGNARTQNIEILTSTDGVNYTSVLKTKTSGTTLLPERYDLGGINSKYIKLECSGTSAGTWNSITEMYAYVK